MASRNTTVMAAAPYGLMVDASGSDGCVATKAAMVSMQAPMAYAVSPILYSTTTSSPRKGERFFTHRRPAHEGPLATDALHQQHLKAKHCHDLDQAEEARHQQVGSAGADGRKDLRGVVRQRRVAGELLAQLHRNRDHEPVPVRWQHELSGGEAVGGMYLLPNALQDLRKFCRDFARLDAAAHPDQAGEAFVDAADLGEPSGALFDQQHAQPDHSAGYQLERQRDLPLHRHGLDSGVDTIINPVRDAGARGEKELEETTEPTANLPRAHLRRIDRDKHGGGADAQATHSTADIETDDAVRVHDLQNCPELKNDRRHDQRPTPSITRCDGPNAKAAEKGASLEHTDGIGVYIHTLRLGVLEIFLK